METWNIALGTIRRRFADQVATRGFTGALSCVVNEFAVSPASPVTVFVVDDVPQWDEAVRLLDAICISFRATDTMSS